MQNVGLDAWTAARLADGTTQTSGTPPLGEAIAPISGFPGDGAAVAALTTGQGSPGSVRWHGGQWVMPYSEPPSSTLLNVSCDIWNPTTSVPANVLVEVVSSNGQVLGSVTAPPSTTAVIRAWPFVGSHPVVSGEQLVVRLSAKDAATGAWTTVSQDATVIGCAVNAALATTRTIGKAILLTDVVATAGSVGGSTAIPMNGLGVTAGDGATFYVRFPDLPSDNQITGVTIGFSNVNSRANSTVSIASTGAGDPAAVTFTDIAGSTLTNAGTAQKSISGLSISPTPGQVFYLKVVTGTSGWGSSTLPSMVVAVNAP